MDFNGDARLDLREFLQLVTAMKDRERDELMDLSENFATTTTSHGLGRAVTETTLYRRGMYSVVFLSCLSVFGMFCNDFVNQYFNYGSTSSVKIVNKDALSLPMITVCASTYLRCDCPLWYRHSAFQSFRCVINVTSSENSLDSAAPCGYSHKGGIAGAEAEIMSYIDGQHDVEQGILNIPEALLLRFASHKFVLNQSAKVQRWPQNLLSSESVLISCMHGSVDCAKQPLWDVFLDYRHGVCATYRPDKNNNKLQAGKFHSLRLMMRAHHHSSLIPDLRSQHSIHEESGHGFKLFLEPPEEPRALTKGFSVSPGQKATVGLKVGIFDETSLVDPADDSWMGMYTNCTSQPNVGYESCLNKCAMKRLLDICGCYPLHGEAYDSTNGIKPNVPTCSMRNDLGFLNSSCYSRKVEEENVLKGNLIGDQCCGLFTLRSAAKKDAGECRDNCRARCLRYEFETVVRSVRWPSLREAAQIAAALTPLNESQSANHPTTMTVGQDLIKDVQLKLEKEVVSVTITPESMQVMHVSNSMEMDIAGLFGSIGGTLGLCIGFSIITMFELVDFLIRLLWLLTHRTARATLNVMEDVSNSVEKAAKNSSQIIKFSTSSILPSAPKDTDNKTEKAPAKEPGKAIQMRAVPKPPAGVPPALMVIE